MSYYGWRPYVPVAERRRQAENAKLAKLKKKGQSVSPVKIEGRAIAKTFWGKSWCTNLERYSDYENRLPRGRTYVRNGSVVDLQIAKGKVTAMVSGSDLYKVEITIAPVAAARWKAICRDCAGTIDSLVELLQGRLWPRASWTGSAGRAMACFPRPRKSSCPAAVRTGLTCANTSRRRSMASAPGSTKSLNCSSCCAAWMKMNCSPVPDRDFRWQEQHPVRQRCSTMAM